MNIEQIKTYEEQLSELGKRQNDASIKYYKARRKHAELHTYMQIEIAKRLGVYRKIKPNIGVEMALLWRLEEAINEGDKAFQDKYALYEIKLAEYKALDRALDSLQNQQIAVQGIMKWSGNADTYGRTD